MFMPLTFIKRRLDKHRLMLCSLLEGNMNVDISSFTFNCLFPIPGSSAKPTSIHTSTGNRQKLIWEQELI